jgi:hypothetical protein
MVKVGGVLMQKLRRLGLAILLIGAVALGGCFLFPNHPPVASVTITNSSEDPLIIDLDASGSTDADGDEIVAYMWVFGGDVEIITPLTYSATVTVPVITVDFQVEGTYNVTLVVKDAREMLSAPLTVEITVPLPEE